jgi:voltage-gated potassium channel Kch
MLVAQIIKKLVKRLRKSSAGILSLATLAIVALGTIGAFLAERQVNSEFTNLGTSLWWTLVTMSTVGYGDIMHDRRPCADGFICRCSRGAPL